MLIGYLYITYIATYIYYNTTMYYQFDYTCCIFVSVSFNRISISFLCALSCSACRATCFFLRICVNSLIFSSLKHNNPMLKYKTPDIQRLPATIVSNDSTIDDISLSPSSTIIIDPHNTKNNPLPIQLSKKLNR